MLLGIELAARFICEANPYRSSDGKALAAS